MVKAHSSLCWFRSKTQQKLYFLSQLLNLPLCLLTVTVNKTSWGKWTATKLSSFVCVCSCTLTPLLVCVCHPPALQIKCQISSELDPVDFQERKSCAIFHLTAAPSWIRKTHQTAHTHTQFLTSHCTYRANHIFWHCWRPKFKHLFPSWPVLIIIKTGKLQEWVIL